MSLTVGELTPEMTTRVGEHDVIIQGTAPPRDTVSYVLSSAQALRPSVIFAEILDKTGAGVWYPLASFELPTFDVIAEAPGLAIQPQAGSTSFVTWSPTTQNSAPTYVPALSASVHTSIPLPPISLPPQSRIILQAVDIDGSPITTVVFSSWWIVAQELGVSNVTLAVGPPAARGR